MVLRILSLRRRRRHPWSGRLWAVFLVAVGYAIGVHLNAAVLAVGELQVRREVTRGVATAIRHRLTNQVQPDRLFLVRILSHQALIQPNLGEIDRLAAEATVAIQKELSHLEQGSLTVPLSRILGFRLPTNRRLQLPLSLSTAEAVEVKFREDFHPIGINQAMLSIFLDTDTALRLATPFGATLFHLRLEVPLAQEWYAGEVPQAYSSTPLRPSRPKS